MSNVLLRIRTLRRTGGHLYSLILERMSEVDFGEYLCEARNSLGSGKAHLQISGKEDRTENRLSEGGGGTVGDRT